MLRRVRGLFSMAMLWSVPWALAATGLAFVVYARGGYQQRRLDAYLALIDWPTWAGGSFGYLAMRGGLVGVTNGLLLAGAIFIAYRRGPKIERLAGWQFALLGSLATGAVSTMLLRMPSAMVIVSAAVGAVSGAAYLALAKRSARIDGGVDSAGEINAMPNEPLQIADVERHSSHSA